jgi:nicotinate phosphoribosyltransferase
MDDGTTPLLTDLYQLNMIQAYLDHGETKTAVFEFFVRKLPGRRSFLVAAGHEQALAFLENLQFSAEEIDWLARSGRFGKKLLGPTYLEPQCRAAAFADSKIASNHNLGL